MLLKPQTFLTAPEQRSLRALLDAYLPHNGAGAPSASAVALPEKFEAAFAGCTPLVRRQIRLLLAAAEHFPLLTRKLRRFSRMSEGERKAFLESLDRDGRHHPVAPLYELMKMLSLMIYFETEPVRRLIQHDGLPLKQPVLLPPLKELAHYAYPRIEKEVAVHADVCVVGSGAGGAVVADTLSRAGFKVAVVEEGFFFNRPYFRSHTPFERMRTLYRNNGLTATMGNTFVALPMGKTVGGTTVVNSGTCFRAPEERLRHWVADWGASLFTPETFTACYEEVEAFLNVRDIPEEVLGNNAKVMRRGCERLGLKGRPIRRPLGNCHGSGECPFGCPTDAKLAMHISFLPRAVAQGAKIFAGCRVEHIYHRDGRAHSLTATILDPAGSRRGRLRVTFQALFLCAGAIYTPVLLKTSGLAPNTHAGRHLRIGPACGAIGLFDEEINGWKGTLQSFYLEDTIPEGILMEATFTPPGMATSTWLRPFGRELMERVTDIRNTAIIGVMASDDSEGWVVSRRPYMIYNLIRKDVARLTKGLAIAARILFAAGAKEVHTLCYPFRRLRGEADIRELETSLPHPSSFHLSAFHPVGTCRMGADPSRCVVGPEGKVHGTENVYVADASLFPTSLKVNPQISINAAALAIARRWALGRP